jgi:cytochrome b pre-mRNA-processing protein 3
MGLLSFLRRTRQNDATSAAIYLAVVKQARSPAFYSALAVPDTVDGRFDLILIHAMLVMRRLRAEGSEFEDLTQGLFDYMFKDMDRSLREIGVGDMSVGKHVKKMAKAFYGRAEEYEIGMDGGSAEALNDALKRNIYRRSTPTAEQLAAMSSYLLAADAALNSVATHDVALGRLTWPSISGQG